MSQRTRAIRKPPPSTSRRQTERDLRRVRFNGPPPNAVALSGWALLPLRAFLGLTFSFAGLQKLANPNFFNSSNPASIQGQLAASIRVSPIHAILAHLTSAAVPIGIGIAIAELAVGLGTLVGLWSRLAATGGVLLALTLFLTVSFHASPYYTGADIVFVFAWIPIILAGTGGVLSIDGILDARIAKRHNLGPSTVVPVSFAVIQQTCGHYKNDMCAARPGRHCDVVGCPYLSGQDLAEDAGSSSRHASEELDRRAVVLGGAALTVATLAGAAAGLGRAVGGTRDSAGEAPALGAGQVRAPNSPGNSSTTTTVPASSPTTTTMPGRRIGLASQVPVGGSARFTDPLTGNPGLILQPSSGRFIAYDAVCPHAGCTVGYAPSADLIVCPCHGSEFDPRTGAVVAPPASRGLSPIQVAVDANGELIVRN